MENFPNIFFLSDVLEVYAAYTNRMIIKKSIE